MGDEAVLAIVVPCGTDYIVRTACALCDAVYETVFADKRQQPAIVADHVQQYRAHMAAKHPEEKRNA